MSKEPYLVVTPEQYGDGYIEYLGAQIPNTRRHTFSTIRQLPDGNYLVRNPDVEHAGSPTTPTGEPPASQRTSTKGTTHA